MSTEKSHFFPFFLLAFLLSMLVYLGSHWLDASKGKLTVSRMMQLSQVLEVEQPDNVSDEVLTYLYERNPWLGEPTDGWGNALVVTLVEPSEGKLEYRIVSPGKDGVLGLCCRRDLKRDWDEDSVLEGGVWLQTW